MPVHEANDVLLEGGYAIRAYRDLPRTHQLAIAYYLAVDHQAWASPEAMLAEALIWGEANQDQPQAVWKAFSAGLVDRHLAAFVAAHGDEAFGMATIPMAAAQRRIMAAERGLSDRFGSWDAYHAWYATAKTVPGHPDHDRWPCFLSEAEGEVFEDGWHRFHRYAQAGHADLPVVFVPTERHRRR